MGTSFQVLDIQEYACRQKLGPALILNQNPIFEMASEELYLVNFEIEEIKMKMLAFIKFPHEPFNTLVKNGRAGEIIGQIIEELRPESIYFTEQDGSRGAVALFEVENSSRIPFFAEPFFLHFNADCQFRIAMSPADLRNAGLNELGKKWA